MPEPLIIRILDVTGNNLAVSAEDGQLVHDKIAPVLQDGRAVRLSFQGIDTIISAFLNAAVGQLYGEFSEETIRDLLAIEEMAPEDLALLKRVVDNAKRYFANRPTFDKAWQEEVEDDEE